MSGSDKLAISYVDPGKLKVAKRNARTHSAKQLALLAEAIRAYGFTNPILVDGHHRIIAGHGRHSAALVLKLKQVPVITLKGLSSAQQRALALADNRIALSSGWDEDALAAELRELKDDEGVDLSSLGFDEKELQRILGAANGEDAGDVEYKEGFAVIVECDSERAQTKLLERFSKEGLKCKALIA